MTRRLLLLSAIFITAAAVLKADPIVVRSGEHAAFTRLVLPLPTGADWQIESFEGRSTLVFTGFSDGFDVSRAFDIIPRKRLIALLARPSRLEMQLRCDCPVNAFIERGRYLVLDILDGPEISIDSRIELFSSQLPSSEFDFGELLWAIEDEDEADRRREEGATAEDEPVSEASPTGQEAEQALVLQTQEQLLQAFSRAASRGVLNLNEDAVIGRSEVVTNVPDVDIFDSSAVQTSTRAPGASNIRITDSRDLPSHPSEQTLSHYGMPCADPALVDVNSWGTAEPFGLQMANSNELLFDELGRANPARVIERARLYLFFGFGAEARQTLALVPGLRHSEPELMDIASIMEYGYAPNPKSLHRFAACDSDLALWSILAGRETPLDIAINAHAAIRALQRLPVHLRQQIAKDLGERLLQRDDVENARIAMRIYEKLLGNDAGQPDINSAMASSTEGETEEKRQILDAIISNNTPEAPTALSVLVDSMISMGESIPPDVTLLAEAFAFEHRKDENAPEHYRTFVRAAAASGQFDKAFEALRNPPDDFPLRMSQEVARFAVSSLSEGAPDSEFLSHYFADYPLLKNVLGEDERLEVAARLIETGFVEEAEAVLDTMAQSFRSDARDLVSGELFLSKGEYQSSLRAVAALDGPAASRIRGEALQRIGENEAAAENFTAADMPDRAISALWLSENWASLIEQDTPVFGPLSTIATEGSAAISIDEDMLENSFNAISESASVRSSLQSGLDALQLSEQ